jgi:hypothetical protein
MGLLKSVSSLPSPVILKNNRDLSFCMESKKLKDVTRKNCFPLPHIDDTLDTLAGATQFSTLDL